MGVEAACKASHIKALFALAGSKDDWGIIIEDDIFFLDRFEERLKQVVSELPEDWAAIWLGGFEKVRSEKYSENANRVISQLGAFAYVVRKDFANTLIGALDRGTHLTTDGVYAQIQKRYKCFRAVLVGHHSGWSTIQRRNVDYKQLREV